jgi:hypothetical protein
MLIKDPPNLPATAQNPSAVDDGFVVAGRVRPLEVNLLYPLDLDDDRCLLARYRIKTVYGESVREKRGRSHSVRPPWRDASALDPSLLFRVALRNRHGPRPVISCPGKSLTTKRAYQ